MGVQGFCRRNIGFRMITNRVMPICPGTLTMLTVEAPVLPCEESPLKGTSQTLILVPFFT